MKSIEYKFHLFFLYHNNYLDKLHLVIYNDHLYIQCNYDFQFLNHYQIYMSHYKFYNSCNIVLKSYHYYLNNIQKNYYIHNYFYLLINIILLLLLLLHYHMINNYLMLYFFHLSKLNNSCRKDNIYHF